MIQKIPSKAANAKSKGPNFAIKEVTASFTPCNVKANPRNAKEAILEAVLIETKEE